IGFERSDDLRQRVAQRMLRLPAEQLVGAADVDGIVVVGDVNHPRANEGILAENIVLNPCAGLGENLRNSPCLPRLAANKAADLGLQNAIAHDLRLPEQQGELRGELLAPLDQPRYGVSQIIKMQEGLPGPQVTWIEMAGRIFLVNSGDLIGEKGVAAKVVVDARRTNIDDRDRTVLLVNQMLGL